MCGEGCTNRVTGHRAKSCGSTGAARGLSPSLRALQRAFWKQGQNGAKSAFAKVNNRDKQALCEDQKLQRRKAWRHEALRRHQVLQAM